MDTGPRRDVFLKIFPPLHNKTHTLVEVGKVLEGIISKKLQKYADYGKGLANNQYEFRWERPSKK